MTKSKSIHVQCSHNFFLNLSELWLVESANGEGRIHYY
jgi:hypothetical protein